MKRSSSSKATGIHHPPIYITGSMSFDVIMDFPSRFGEHIQPDKLHMLNVSFIVDAVDKQIGGTASNIAYSLGLLGYPDAQLISSVGKDGDPIVEYLKEVGVNTSHVLKDESVYSATGHVITDIDNNQIWGFYYGACEAATRLELPMVQNSGNAYTTTTDKLSTAETDLTTSQEPHSSTEAGQMPAMHASHPIAVVSASHKRAFLHFQKQAIEKKIPFMFDPGMTLSWNKPEDVKEGVIHCKWLVGNDYEISAVLSSIGITAEDIIQNGTAIITTLGNDGVRYQDNNTEEFIPAYQPKAVKDPTGAGDAWRAGFLYGYATGKTIRQALCIGNATASFAVENYGTINHSPTSEEIFDRAHMLEKIVEGGGMKARNRNASS